MQCTCILLYCIVLEDLCYFKKIKVKSTMINNPIFNDQRLIQPLMKKILNTEVRGKKTACLISSTVNKQFGIPFLSRNCSILLEGFKGINLKSD